ncbi:MAG: hypothetical protein RQ715_03070 [Methylococcales bacterium]|nr:hypothetical protein [Methylococcales bacterium]
MTLTHAEVLLEAHLLLTFGGIFNFITIGRTHMGAILDLTEMLKEPAGMVGAIVVIGAAYFLVKWVFAEPKDDDQQ